MMRERIRMAAAGIAVLALVAGAAACGDDGGKTLTLEEYFRKVAALDVEQQAATDKLDPAFEQLEPDDVEGARDLFDQQLDVLDDFVEELDKLNPPEEVKETHDEALALFREFRAAFGDALDQAGDAETIDDMFAGFDEAAFAKIEQANEKCRELEQIAADNDIEVNLDCDDQ